MNKSPLEQSAAFQEKYSETQFWDKAKSFAKSAGIKVLDPALTLFYTARDENTPTWAKTAVYGALGYFIAPIDAIPDLAPLIGFTDDLGVLSAAVITIGIHVQDKHRKNASATIKAWFG